MDSCGAQRETQFRQIVAACIDQTDGTDGAQPPRPYHQPRLVRLFYERMQTTDALRERFLDAFFEHVTETAGDAASGPPVAHVGAFADALVDTLFLPLKAVGGRYGRLVRLSDGPETETAICIFPPSPLTEADEDGDLSPAGEAAAEMLSMLDSRAQDLLAQGGTGNTVVLQPRDIRAFCQFELGQDSTAVDEAPPLLTLHRTMAQILDKTGAGMYIDSILADTGVEDLQTDGTSHLGRLMQLRLDGWWDGGGQRRQDWWVDDGEFREE